MTMPVTGSKVPFISTPPIRTLNHRMMIVVAVIILVSVVGVVDSGVYFSTRSTQRKHSEEQNANQVTLVRRIIRYTFASLAADLRFLAEETEDLGWPSGGAGNDLDLRLARRYHSFCRHMKVYDQIRFLDTEGNERVRVNYFPDRVETVPASQLQSRRDSPEFIQTIGLARGRIYAAPLELNTEHGQVERPLKPTIRLATPVFDRTGLKRGLVVVNYLAVDLLDRLDDALSRDSARAVVVDPAGYWLLAPIGNQEWGFMLPERRDFSMGRQWPEAWRDVAAGEQGQAWLDVGLLSWATIYPNEEIGDTGVGFGDERESGAGSRKYHWKVGALMSGSILTEETSRLLDWLLVMNLIIGLLLGSGAWFLDRSVNRRRAAQAEFHRLSQAVEQSPATVVITDTNGRITYVNPKFTETTGYESAEALGQFPSILKSGGQPKEFYDQLWRTISGGGIWRGEMQNRRKDGRIYWEMASISPIRDEAGRITHYLAIKEDITERKRTESELGRAMEAASRANQAKNEFLANMSHELRTPMNVIIGLTDLLHETDSTPGQQEYLSLIGVAARGLLDLLNDLLDLSRLESNRMDLGTVCFDLRGTVAEVLAPLDLEARSKGLSLEQFWWSDVPVMLMGDSERLKQVIRHLVGNAIKFTAEGRVTFEVQRQSKTDRRMTLHFRVTDTGIGIPAEKHEVIFSFTQADGSTTREYGGTGLGLCLSRHLVDLMGGRLWLESEVGRGSIFHFTATFLEEECVDVRGVPETSAQTGDAFSGAGPSDARNRMDAVLDRAEIWERVGQDQDLLREMIGLFLEQLPDQVDEIKVAATHQQGPELIEAARKLGGSASHFSARALGRVLKRMEGIGREAHWADAPATISLLVTETARLRQALKDLAETG